MWDQMDKKEVPRDYERGRNEDRDRPRDFDRNRFERNPRDFDRNKDYDRPRDFDHRPARDLRDKIDRRRSRSRSRSRSRERDAKRRATSPFSKAHDNWRNFRQAKKVRTLKMDYLD